MATIYDVKSKFQSLLRPTVQRLAQKGITPNQITWSALFLSVVVGIIIGISRGATWILLLMPVILFIRMALNAMDGILAKEYDLKSKSGAMLNEMGDVVSDAVLYLPFVFVPGIDRDYLLVLFVLIGVFAEMAGVLGWVLGSERRYDGPMGKSDRAFFMGAVALLLGVGVSPGPWLDVLLVVAILMGVKTTINRARKGIS